MLFKEMGNQEHPTIILLHGGGLSDWSLSGAAALLKENYHVVTPILEGHGENGGETFVSIEQSADRLLEYVDSQCDGKVFALGGLSIGAQIAIEALSRRCDIARFAILESALILPMKAVTAWTVPMYTLTYGLIKMKWFSRMQAKALFVSDCMLERYYADSLRMSKQSLINMALSNGNYTLKNGIGDSKAKALIIAGEREIGVMKKSARILKEKIPGSTLHFARHRGHGELSLAHPSEYVKVVTEFFAQ